LRSYHVLDTDAEDAYDEITRLAAYICDVPISMISLVDGKRQWFKAKVGLKQKGTPRDVAFCAHAILTPEPLVVKDALKDGRFAKSPLVKRSPSIRFYAGFPLINPEGHALGTLCAIDRKPRELSPRQKDAMELLARQVMSRLELRRVSNQLAQALEHVKTLHGLLPICAWCKRIRDDQGYWSQVEAYVTKHSDAEFTHGICPQCFEKQRSQRGGESDAHADQQRKNPSRVHGGVRVERGL
jgi:GAF domain-containing protein